MTGSDAASRDQAPRSAIRRVGARRVVSADTVGPGEAVADSKAQTRDDTDDGWGAAEHRSRESSHDEWLREQRPPHWG